MAGLSNSVVMTAEGLKALQAELEQLETVARREIAERIKTAREWGDLKENSEYHDAKNDQAHLETKILRIREQLLNAEVREVATTTDVVGFGNKVLVESGNPPITMTREADTITFVCDTGDFMLRARVADALMTVCDHGEWRRCFAPED